ncbi:Uma2 family endonuclease [Methylobacterium tarhaniae]|uniref:Uma2 family endonuclease n=1 Tax=Methylobacterium tarhaniae TaxID=1187852 RepID=UPI002478138E|nr:Uma2 family endonuclease [Methylobacterium tarhaniae]
MDRGRKAGLYARNGVREYWVIDAQARGAVVHRARRMAPTATWRSCPGLRCCGRRRRSLRRSRCRSRHSGDGFRRRRGIPSPTPCSDHGQARDRLERGVCAGLCGGVPETV